MLEKIREKIKLCNSGETVVVGIGNPIRGDDGLGYHFIKQLEKLNLPGLNCIEAGENPENYIGKIININPDNFVMIDAAELNEKPGTAGIIEKELIDETGLSTHSISLKYFLKSIEDEVDLKNIILIGVQPHKIGCFLELTPVMEQVKNDLVELFKQVWETF